MRLWSSTCLLLLNASIFNLPDGVGAADGGPSYVLTSTDVRRGRPPPAGMRLVTSAPAAPCMANAPSAASSSALLRRLGSWAQCAASGCLQEGARRGEAPPSPAGRPACLLAPPIAMSTAAAHTHTRCAAPFPRLSAPLPSPISQPSPSLLFVGGRERARSASSSSITPAPAMPSALALLRWPAFVWGGTMLFWCFQGACLTGLLQWWKLWGPRSDVEAA